MAALSGDRVVREVGLDIEIGRARDMAGEVLLAAFSRSAELPATIDELVSHPRHYTRGLAGARLAPYSWIMTAHVLVAGDLRVAWREGRLVDPNDVPDATVHDLGPGRTILPGFIDAHHHAGLHALYGGAPRLAPPEVTDIESLQRAIAAEAERTRDGWIVVTDWDEERLAERRAPTRQELDDACPDRPVLAMHYSFHRAVANSRALEEGRIDRNTADPSGGIIERGRDGVPSGLLIERAMGAVESRARASLLARDADGFVTRLGLHYEALVAKGITRIVDAMVPEPLAVLFEEAARRGLVRVPTMLMPCATSGGYLDAPWSALEERPTGEARGPNLTVGPLKLVFDGSPVCAMCLGWWQVAGSVVSTIALTLRHWSLGALRTSMSTKPALGAKLRTGILLYDPSEATKIIREATARGFRIATHAIGNAAVDLALDAYEEVKPPYARIEHSMALSELQIARLADVGAAVVTQPNFLMFPAIANAPTVPGLTTFPIRSLLARGVVVAGSSDFPCASFDPMLGIRSAMDRLTSLGDVREPDERVSREEAIALYTKNAALAAGCLDECGSLDVGKRADLVVLEGDDVRATIVAGEVVYGAI